MRIAILGGTFDPIHVGHMVIAEEAMAKLDLDTVMFVPAGDPWMKRDDVMARFQGQSRDTVIILVSWYNKYVR